MKNSSDTIGNRTRGLPACSAVRQSTAPLRALLSLQYRDQIQWQIVLRFSDSHKIIAAIRTDFRLATELILLKMSLTIPYHVGFKTRLFVTLFRT
jgi:hypothetical protein